MDITTTSPTKTQPTKPQGIKTRGKETQWLGTTQEKQQAALALFWSSLIISTYVLLAHLYYPEIMPVPIEIAGTITSLACVWLVRKQNILSMPIGLISVILMGKFFFDIDLPGQGWLHIAYYIPIQIWGWHIWLNGGANKTRLPVTHLTNTQRTLGAAGLTVGTIGLWVLFKELHGNSDYLLWDSSIVAASIGAQLLLSWKKAESWWLWAAPVNMSAIALYTLTEAYLFAALYVIYLILAFSGLKQWKKAEQGHETTLAYETATTNQALPIGTESPT